MPSTRHDGLVMMFRERPKLAVEVLRDVLQVELEHFTRVEVVSADLTEVLPLERRADLVVVLREKDRPVHVVIVEPQLRWKAEKRRGWVGYVGEAYQRYGCRVSLLVVTPSAAVARKAAEPIVIDGPGTVVTPRVLGPGLVPVIVGAKEAKRNPELAVVSVMAHGHEASAAKQAEAALRAVVGLDDPRARTYADLVFGALSKAMRRALEEQMSTDTQFQSEFARKYVALGIEQGREEGVSAGEAKALLAVLRARGISVGATAAKRISACTDAAQLERWIERAAVVTEVRELFAPSRVKKPSSSKSTKKSRAR